MSSCRNLDFSVPGTIVPEKAESMQKSKNTASQLVRALGRAPVGAAQINPMCYSKDRVFYTVSGEIMPVTLDIDAAPRK
jgi:hypothetical protein